VKSVTVDEWLAGIAVMKAKNPNLWGAQTRHTFELVDASGYAAVAKLEVHMGPAHFAMDYKLSLPA
jgi:hypothetical protein